MRDDAVLRHALPLGRGLGRKMVKVSELSEIGQTMVKVSELSEIGQTMVQVSELSQCDSYMGVVCTGR